MLNHELIRKGKRFKREVTFDSKNWEYDKSVGAWVSTNDKNMFMIMSDDDEDPRPTSKKADLETGEDMKGE